MNAQQAIDRSVSHNEIVHVAYDVELRAELGDACEDSVDGNDEIEFWGTTDAGDEWRVHMARPAITTAHEYTLAHGWDFSAIEATARLGVSEVDEGALRETGVTTDDLLAWCRDRVAAG